jgi:hypothetical protein
MHAYRLRIARERKAKGLRENTVISSLYNTQTDERFFLGQLYVADDVLIGDLRASPRVHAGVEWSSVPDGAAMLLFPPADVSDQIYETQVLRDIPVERALALMAGEGGSAALPAQLAAQAAVREVLQAVIRDRRDLRGQHLVRSAAQTAQSLIASASSILRTCYGVSAGVTLVRGDDPIFTCLRGGVVARLMARNFDVFAESLQLPQDAKTQAEYWIPPRRAMVDFFAQALVEQAALALDAERDGGHFTTPSIQRQCEEAARSFYRVREIDSSGECSLVVASSMAHSLWFTTPATSQANLTMATRSAALEFIREVSQDAVRFKDQEGLQRENLAFQPVVVRGSFASRRLDPARVRDLPVEGTRENLDRILADLSALSVEDDNTQRRIYMSPFGSRLQALPGADAFDAKGVASKLVWTQLVTQVDVEVTSTPPVDAVVIKCSLVRPFESNTRTSTSLDCEQPSGYARHPCALSACGRQVDVSLVSYPPIASVQTTYNTLEGAILALEAEQQGSADASSRDGFMAVTARVRRMRALAFNTDRLMHAMGLALAGDVLAGKARSLHFELPSKEDGVALLLATAMLQVELGLTLTRCSVTSSESRVGNGLAEVMADAKERFDNARQSGLKVMTFAEACLAASRGEGETEGEEGE